MHGVTWALRRREAGVWLRLGTHQRHFTVRAGTYAPCFQHRYRRYPKAMKAHEAATRNRTCHNNNHRSPFTHFFRFVNARREQEARPCFTANDVGVGPTPRVASSRIPPQRCPLPPVSRTTTHSTTPQPIPSKLYTMSGLENALFNLKVCCCVSTLTKNTLTLSVHGQVAEQAGAQSWQGGAG